MNNIIKVLNVSHYYDGKVILDHINFNFNEGDYFVIWGKVGSGKTTIFNLLTKNRVLMEGKIDIFGIGINDYSDKGLELLDEKIAFMPSNIYFDEDLNVSQNMALICRTPKISEAEALKRVDALYLIRKNMLGLNGIERIKIYLAGLIMRNPKALILDEPTGSLVGERAKEINDILDRIHQSGVSIIVLTKKNDNFKKGYKIKTINEGRLI